MAAPRGSFFHLVLVAAAAAVLSVPGASASRPGRALQARPISASEVWFTECDNTVETRDNVTDDTGVLCSRDKLDYETGCCDAFQGNKNDCSR